MKTLNKGERVKGWNGTGTVVGVIDKDTVHVLWDKDIFDGGVEEIGVFELKRIGQLPLF